MQKPSMNQKILEDTMGRKTDRFLFTLFGAVLFYFHFRARFNSRIICCLLALFSSAVILRLIYSIAKLLSGFGPLRRRALFKNAGSSLVRLACMETEQASQIVTSLIRAQYRESCDCVFLQLHPSLKLTAESVFSTWRAHAGSARLVICTSAKADPPVHLFARSMNAPKTALLDAQSLLSLIAEHPEIVPGRQDEPKIRINPIKRAFCLLKQPRNSLRCLMLSASMLLLYVFSGGILYLISALLLFWFAIAALRIRKMPVKLF